MPSTGPSRETFASRLLAWQRAHGRRGLPWQGTRDPYRIWLSEIMLQQTQVATVVPYYERFLARFPDVHALAAASEDEVLRLWSGLGYYARGRNLRAAARDIVARHGGRFPRTAEALAALPGVGRSTAAAIAAFAYGRREAILDGNVKRVLARRFGIAGWPGERAVEMRLWALAESLLPARGIERYTQGLMDLGATLCKARAPECGTCPFGRSCVARKKGLLGSLPGARPRRPLPVKQATWLVLRHAGQVLLERRPSAGLWGGLWTFPEAPAAGVQAYAARELGCTLGRLRRLEPLGHGFTHFRLEIHPVLCEVAACAPAAQAPGRMWMAAADAMGAAVPAPVRKVLRALA